MKISDEQLVYLYETTLLDKPIGDARRLREATLDTLRAELDLRLLRAFLMWFEAPEHEEMV